MLILAVYTKKISINARKICKVILISTALLLSGIVVLNMFTPKMMKVKSVEKHAIVAEISSTNGIKVIMDNDDQGWGSWVPVLQLLTILLGTYGGMKVINK